MAHIIAIIKLNQKGKEIKSHFLAIVSNVFSFVPVVGVVLRLISAIFITEAIFSDK